MKCPHCDVEIPGVSCPGCGETVPEGSNYCMACGAPMRADVPPAENDDVYEEGNDELDLENRVLCPDGTCTGIIVDGKCTECGRREGEIEDPEEAAADAPEDQERTDDTTQKGMETEKEG